MPKCWLAISNRANWEVAKNNKIWGVSYRNRKIIAKVKSGDFVLFYISSQYFDKKLLPVIVTGAFEVTAPVFEEHTKIFSTPQGKEDEVYPFRIKLKPIKIFINPILFVPLIPKLSFISNKRMWNGYIRGRGIREIPEEDYNEILNSIMKK
ncbi:MAG TPA: EVE domain-containing protein [Candidatus Atribacteria bacterium]|nr:EVE domain-containing protein [Candidatus Atribacteria bacterium]